MTPNITIQESLIYLMVTMSAVDRHMDDKELARIGRLVQFLPVFDQFDEADILPAAQTCHKLLSEPEGLDIILEIIKEAVPQRLHDTAYAIAVEIASADHGVKVEEIRLLQLLRDRFGLDKLTCAALERSAIARYRNAGV
jgi:tellurite resistance protein